MTITQHSPQSQSISKQLQLLGYGDGDAVFYRTIGTHSRKIAGNGITIPPELQQINSSGSGIYLVVNGGGQTDGDVTHGRAVFFEHDNLPKPTLDSDNAVTTFSSIDSHEKFIVYTS